jgi:hypothetical protein
LDENRSIFLNVGWDENRSIFLNVCWDENRDRFSKIGSAQNNSFARPQDGGRTTAVDALVEIPEAKMKR